MKFLKFFSILLFLIAISVSLYSEDRILIGGSLSFSKGNTEQSGMLYNGYRLWIDEINAEGGLLDRPVELLVYDDEGDPQQVEYYYHKLVNEDKADLVLSPYSTPLTLIASEITEKAGIPMVAAGAAGRAIWSRGYRYIFGIYAPADRFPIGFLDVCAREGYEHVGIVYEKSSFHEDVYESTERWSAKFGLKISSVSMVYTSTGAVDLKQAVLRLQQSSPDAVFISLYPNESYKLITLMKQNSYKPSALAIVISPIHPDFYSRAGLFAEGVFAPSEWEPMERIPYPDTLAFIKAYRDRYGEDPSYHAGAAYGACQILSWGVKACYGINYEMLRNYIASLDTVTVIGRFKVDNTGIQVGHNPILIQWQDAEKEIVYPQALQTSEPRFP